MFSKKRFLLIVIALIINASCSSTNSLRSHKGSYLESVKVNYDAGMKAMAASEYDKAIGYFQFVRSKYPFSQYAALSDLNIANVKFKQEKWLDAASAYEVFVRLHPRHEQVPFATYKIGMSYFYAVPTDFFLLPSSTSRDQSFTKEALKAIETFLSSYPDSEHAEEAKTKQKILYTNLSKHHIHIANHYYERGEMEAALNRYLLVDKENPGTNEAFLALMKAAKIQENKLKNSKAALEILERLTMAYEQHPKANEVKADYEELKAKLEND